MMCVELWEPESGSWMNLESGRGGNGGIAVEEWDGGHM